MVAVVDARPIKLSVSRRAVGFLATHCRWSFHLLNRLLGGANTTVSRFLPALVLLVVASPGRIRYLKWGVCVLCDKLSPRKPLDERDVGYEEMSKV